MNSNTLNNSESQPYMSQGDVDMEYGIDAAHNTPGCLLRTQGDCNFAARLGRAERQLSEVIAERDQARNGERNFSETLEAIREALGQKETHYLVMADDVRDLRAERDSLREQVERLKGLEELAVEVATQTSAQLSSLQARVEREDGLLQETLSILGVKGGDFVSLCSVAESLKEQVREMEYELRRMMWLGHGHLGIYGDDGQMQCSECSKYDCWDYKNGSLESVRAAYRAAQLERFNKAMTDLQENTIGT